MQVSQAFESVHVDVGDATAAQVQEMQRREVGEDCWAQCELGIAGEVERVQGREMLQESAVMRNDQGVEGEVQTGDVIWKGTWSILKALPTAVGPSLGKELLSEMGYPQWAVMRETSQEFKCLNHPCRVLKKQKHTRLKKHMSCQMGVGLDKQRKMSRTDQD